MNSQDENSDVNLLWVGILVEGGLILLALVLGWFGFFDRSQILGELNVAKLIHGAKWGVVALVPMLGYLILFHFWKPSFYQPIQETVDRRIRPMFSNATVIEMLIISILAGIGEELFFRWSLQGGVATLLEPAIGSPFAFGMGLFLASAGFGLCHWVNSTYAVVTFLVGLYLGGVMIWTGTWIAPAIAHSIFDFVALIYIVNSKPPAGL